MRGGRCVIGCQVFGWKHAGFARQELHRSAVRCAVLRSRSAAGQHTTTVPTTQKETRWHKYLRTAGCDQHQCRIRIASVQVVSKEGHSLKWLPAGHAERYAGSVPLSSCHRSKCCCRYTGQSSSVSSSVANARFVTSQWFSMNPGNLHHGVSSLPSGVPYSGNSTGDVIFA
ncbi:hypothetical protein GGTG_13919 [Gaeumannomyces tritici R3-111a-1]|uniref:Uncharacterized protein n=1 Tax=Gaeumannomyces tritici (strain R3-111a-1) TaxID=644352 RepID=J3PK70_GAET3|nr:hypothetical protein GGTG_13919 [Gaeumannomyces tritici R3-111a-1]EJT68501.1 hypothetical protein GGTG_13919 [Gaeumannomyces tritici R3-111a-1]